MTTFLNTERLDHLVQTCRRFFEGQRDGRILGVFLYGSAMRGNSRADSDVDVAVLDAPNDRLSWGDEAWLMDALERATGCVIDLRMIRDCSLSHQAHILQEGKLIWAGDGKAIEDYRQNIVSAYSKKGEVHEQWLACVDRLAHQLGAQR